MKKILILILLICFVPCLSMADILLEDDFEYAISESGTDADNFLVYGPWTGVKAENSTANSGSGWLSTAMSIPGFSGSFPGTSSSRVLKMRCLNISGGTDFYLQYLGGSSEAVPGNVWFQFWIYINRYTGELSAIESRHKFIYPTPDGSWPTWPKWLISFSANSYVPDWIDTFGDPTTGEAFIVNRDMAETGRPNYSPEYPDNHWKLGPNEGATGDYEIEPNTWTLVKIHMDTSNNSSGVMEVWLKPEGEDWNKTTEWIGGVTANFTWSGFGAGGHYGFRMPTTIGWSDRSDGAFYYLDDFVMAESESDLPTYGTDSSPPAIQNLTISGGTIQ